MSRSCVSTAQHTANATLRNARSASPQFKIFCSCSVCAHAVFVLMKSDVQKGCDDTADCTSRDTGGERAQGGQRERGRARRRRRRRRRKPS
eukprot:3116147-Rhodomonas_salina.1